MDRTLCATYELAEEVSFTNFILLIVIFCYLGTHVEWYTPGLKWLSLGSLSIVLITQGTRTLTYSRAVRLLRKAERN